MSTHNRLPCTRLRACGNRRSAVYLLLFANFADHGPCFGLKAFVAAVLGGIGSIPGAMLGGLIIGIAESLTKGYVSSQLADAVVFGILIIVLLVKPTGFFGHGNSEKV